MPKALKPYDCLIKFLDSKVRINIDKWNAGLDNQANDWEELRDKVTASLEDYTYLRKDNAELRVYNNKLKEENEKLNKKLEQFNQIQKEYEHLQKEYDYLVNGEPCDDEDGWEF